MNLPSRFAMLSFINYAEICFVLAAILVGQLGHLLVRAHLDHHPRITGPAQLMAYATLARQQMYLSIVFLFLIVVAISCIFIGDKELPISLRLLLCTPYLLMGVLGRLQKRVEERVRDGTRCDPSVLEPFERISYSWKKKFLPDF
jgi:hypothetical protein